MACTFSIADKSTVDMHKFAITIKAAGGATLKDHTSPVTSWKVEMHDRQWPHNKTMKYENKKITDERENNWNTMTIVIKPKEKGRILVWRAQAITEAAPEAWTEWMLLDCDKLSGDDGGAAQRWKDIFKDLGVEEVVEKEEEKPAMPTWLPMPMPGVPSPEKKKGCDCHSH